MTLSAILPDSADSNSRFLGTRELDISGEGDALFEGIPVSPYIEYLIESGPGNTEVYLVIDYEKAIFSGDGISTGITRPTIDATTGKLRVESDDEWRTYAQTPVQTPPTADAGDNNADSE